MIRTLSNVMRQARARSVCSALRPRAVASRALSADAATQTRVEHAVGDADPNAKFAVISFSGKQYKCVEDDLLICDRQDVDIGSEVIINDVLLIGSPSETIIGRPLVKAASVRTVCEQHPKDKKTIVFKKKRRKGYRRKNGFRRQLTALRVLEINDGSSS